MSRIDGRRVVRLAPEPARFSLEPALGGDKYHPFSRFLPLSMRFMSNRSSQGLNRRCLRMGAEEIFKGRQGRFVTSSYWLVTCCSTRTEESDVCDTTWLSTASPPPPGLCSLLSFTVFIDLTSGCVVFFDLAVSFGPLQPFLRSFGALVWNCIPLVLRAGLELYIHFISASAYLAPAPLNTLRTLSLSRHI